MISLDEVKHLAKLARIKVTDEELLGLHKDLEAILGYVSQIKEAPTKEIDETFVPEHRNVFREDGQPHGSGIYSEDILKQAPQKEGKYIKVKKILG